MPALVAGMTVSDAFAAIAASTLEHLEGNEQGVLAGDDIEFLHQIRVAVRRMRSALSAFSDALPLEAREPAMEDLKWLGGVFGPARDWDVFITQTLPAVTHAFDDKPALALIAEAAARRQTAARGAVRRVMRSQKYRRVMIGLRSWLSSQAWHESAGSKHAAVLATPIRSYAQSELERRYERVRKLGRKVESLAGAELHELRIAVKKLRYSSDFFSALFDTEEARGLRRRLSRLQDTLGEINDAAMLPRLLQDIPVEARKPALAEARGMLLGWSAGRADALRPELIRSWKAFRRSATFW